MSIEMLVLAILAGIVVFALVRGLLFVALIIAVVSIAYYTGLADAFVGFIMEILALSPGDPETALSLIVPLLFL